MYVLIQFTKRFHFEGIFFFFLASYLLTCKLYSEKVNRQWGTICFKYKFSALILDCVSVFFFLFLLTMLITKIGLVEIEN